MSAGFAGIVLLLFLAACPQANDEPALEDPPDPAPTEEPTRDVLALGGSCVNEEVGFRVAYPADWTANEGNGLPACSAFDPEDVSTPEVGEIPAEIAVVIHDIGVEHPRATDFEADFTVDVVTRQEATVGGRSAVIAELESTGEGMYPAGHVSYAYYIDLDDTTLQAVTHDIPAAGPPDYDERRRILDSMMGTVEFVEID